MIDLLTDPTEVHPGNYGPMRNASSRARYKGPCGDTVEIWLRIDGGKIRKATYMSDGCSYSNACCSTAAKLAEGMTPDEAKNMTQADVLEKVGPVPKDHQHCALLAATVIQMALEDFYITPAKMPLGQRIKHLFRKPILEQNHD